MLVNKNPEYFLTVVREKNISRAAKKLFISQPSLSQHIAKLEESLGVKLLDRTAAPLALTPAGELYRNYLESIDFLYKKFEQELDSLRTESSLTINLGIGSWRGTLLLPHILPEFLSMYPNAQINLHEYPVSELAKLIDAGQVDFAIKMTFSGQSPIELVTEQIVKERILLVMNRNDPIALQFEHAKKSGQPFPLHALAQERLITLKESLIVGRLVNNYLEKNQVPQVRRIVTTNNATVIRLVEAGMGFCFLAEAGLESIEEHPPLVYYDLQSEDLTAPLCLCYRRNSYLSPAARDLVRLIEDYYRRTIIGNKE